MSIESITPHGPNTDRREVAPTVRSEVRGVWLPLVTPMKDGALDEVSLKRLLRHLAARPVDGLVVAATTGEGPLLDALEMERLAKVAADELDAAAVAKIHRGNGDHRATSRAIARSARTPGSELFSGWNWMPATRSRRTIAGKRSSSCVVQATTDATSAGRQAKLLA